MGLAKDIKDDRHFVKQAQCPIGGDMTTNWRPSEWKNLYARPVITGPEPCYIGGKKAQELASVFEAGANAMYPFALEKGKAEGKEELLEALREKGEKELIEIKRLIANP